MLNSDVRWWWFITIWALTIIGYYFMNKLWITLMVIMISVCIWSSREVRLNQQLTEVGMQNVEIRLHRNDLTWRDGYLSGMGINKAGDWVRVHGKCDEPPQQDSLRLLAKIDSTCIERQRNQFNFNPQHYWRSKGIVLDYEVIEKSNWSYDKQTSITAWVKTIHVRCIRWFENLPPALRDYGETLVLGYTRSEFYDENKGIQKLGLVHLFSISGFQVTLCHQIWFGLARIGRFYREDTQIGWFGALGFIWLFAGGVQSLIRAILASTLTNYCDLRNQKLSTIDSWGLVVIASLWVEPGVCHQLGGQLSFLLSFGLLWVNNVSFWRANLILNLLIAPSLLTQTYSWQPIGILVNLFVIPIFTYVVIPIVFAGLLFHACQWSVLRDVCEEIILFIQSMIRMGEHIPGELITGQPELWWLILVCITSASILVWRTKLAYGCLIVCYGLIICGIGKPSQAFLAFIDVKQGDATLWRTESQEVYLMDVGGQIAFSNPGQKTQNKQQSEKSTMSAKELCVVLKGFGITTIDHLILSHQDIDHIGNFPIISEHTHIKHIYVPKGMRQTKNYQTKIAPFVQNQTQVHEVLAGEKIGRSNCRVLHPMVTGKGENRDSVTIVGNILGLSFFLSGDLDKAGERAICQRTNLSLIDIMKCGHHGSRTSTSQELLDIIKPKVAIVSAGKHNRFKHPHEEVVSQLQQRGIPMLNTADEGMISYDGYKWRTAL